MKQLFILFAAIATWSCAHAAESARPKTLADVTPPPPSSVQLPEATADDLLSLIASIYPGWPTSDEGRPGMEIDIRLDQEGLFEATIIQSGVLDDSIAEVKDVFQLGRNAAGQWSVIKADQWRKCYRTGMFEWTTMVCP